MASKGPEAFRTISEVADELELPQHVLRFWETKFTPIKPLKRGGGRRFYRPDDVELLRGIRHLLYGEGYTIRGVQRILREQGPRFVIAAGRGDMAGVYAAGPEVEEEANFEDDEGIAPAVHADIDEADDTADIALSIEPTFNPREFRAPVAPAKATPLPPAGLPAADIRRLQSVVAELEELKRLLENARESG